MQTLTPMSPWDALQASHEADVYFNLDDGREVFLASGNRSANDVMLMVDDGYGRRSEPVHYRPDATLYCKVYR